jgi:hypothetical protein
MKAINKAPKRTKAQILRDRERVTELLLMGHTQKQIRDMLYKETGIELSLTTIRVDIGVIRDKWREKTAANFEALMNEELARLKILESEAWRAWRASCEDKQRMVIEKIAREFEGEAEPELIIARVTETLDGSAGDPRFLDKVIDAQKERRRLLGLYAPAKLGIDVRAKQELVIKGYAIRDVSPDVWPEVVEGQIIKGALEDGEK